MSKEIKLEEAILASFDRGEWQPSRKVDNEISHFAATAHKSWQVAEITQAITEADNGEFASDEEINNVSSKWQSHAG